MEIRQVLEHKHLGNGSIILFHNDAKYTPKVLDTILKGIKEKGFEDCADFPVNSSGEFRDGS